MTPPDPGGERRSHDAGELRERSDSERAGGVRCPMCHDLLAELSAGEPVPCPRCGTAHHRACAEELLRCSVLGCGGALADGAPEGPRTLIEAHALAARRRVQERARTLAEGRGPPPPPRASDDVDDVPAFGPLERWGRFSRAQPELALVALFVVPVVVAGTVLLLPWLLLTSFGR